MEDLTYFYIDFTENNLVGKRPETKTEEDLARVVSLGKPPAVLEKFSEMVAIGKHWDWFDEYALHLNAVDTWEKWEAPALPEDVGEDYVAPERPLAPTWVTPRYAGNPLAIYDKQLAKALGIVFQDKNVSLSEVNQNGIASVMAGATLAIEFGGTIFPLNFTVSTKTGDSTLVFESIEDFKLFAITFMQARQVFFN
jgi:hypothetical protein